MKPAPVPGVDVKRLWILCLHALYTLTHRGFRAERRHYFYRHFMRQEHSVIARISLVAVLLRQSSVYMRGVEPGNRKAQTPEACAAFPVM